MKKKMMLSLLLVLLIAVSLSAVSAEDSAAVDDAISEGISDEAVLSIDESDDAVLEDNDENVLSDAKEVWIFNTTTEHVVQVRGEFKAIDHQNPSSVKEFNSSSGDAVIVKGLVNLTEAYSNWTDFDNNFINSYVQKELNVFHWSGYKYYIGDKTLKIKSQDVSVISNDTADNRRYRTVYDNDAVLIGDADYLIGAYGVDNDLTVQHIIEGNYSNVVVYSVKVVAEYNYEEQSPRQPVVIDNTVDKSNLTVYGTLNLKNKVNGAEYQENISLGPVSVKFFLDQKAVDNYSSQVEEKLLLIANSKASYNGTVEIKNFKSDTKISQRTGKVWDNRKYDQQGSVGIASGDYGKETRVYVTVNAQIENDQLKDAWIDNTVDESKTFVTGEIRLVDRSNPSAALLLGLSNSTNSTYSTPDKSIVDKTIDNALANAKSITGDKAVKITIEVINSTNSEWDHRRFDSEVDNISYVRVHIAEGSYGKNVTYNAYVVAEYNEAIKPATKIIAPNRTLYVQDFAKGYTYQAILKDENGTPLSGREVLFTFNNTVYNATTDDNGLASVVLTANKAGSYNVNVKFAGDEKYASASQDATIKLVKVATKFVAPNRVVYVQDLAKGYTYQAILKTKDGKALANKKVLIRFNGKDQVAMTDDKGWVTVNLTANKAGKYDVTIKFAGDSVNDAVEETRSIKLIKETAYIIMKSGNFKANAQTKQVSATLKSKSGALISNAKVSVEVNGVTYIANTDANGVALINIKLTQTGTFDATWKFAGTSLYNARTGTSKIVIR